MNVVIGGFPPITTFETIHFSLQKGQCKKKKVKERCHIFRHLLFRFLHHLHHLHRSSSFKTKDERQLFTLRFSVFPFFRFSVFSSFVHPHSKRNKLMSIFSSFESLIRPLSHQHHSAIYTFYNHESPSFTNQQKKKINKKNKNDRHLVSKTSFNLLVIHV